MNVYITCSYIPPHSDQSIYKLHIEAIQAVTLKSDPADLFFIFGDFNLPQISWHFSSEDGYFIPSISDELCDALYNNVAGFCFYQINGIKNVFGKLLDLVFVNEPKVCSINRSEPLTLPEDLYHPTIEISCNIPNVLPDTNSTRKAKQFCFKRANYNDLNNLLNNTNWLQLLNIQNGEPHNIDDMVDRFYITLFEYLNECVPKFTPCHKTGPPWSTRQLTALKNQKNKYFKKFKKFQLDYYYVKYSALRAEYNRLNMQLYNNHLNNIRTNFLQDPKSFFKFVNSRRKSSNLPKLMKHLDSESSEDTIISDMFADFFSSTYSDAHYDVNSEYPYMINSSQIISIVTVYTSHIVNCIKTFKSSNLSGPDGIPSVVLKNCSSSLAVPLSIIFNISLKYGYFPKIWKESYIIPLFKSGNKSFISNYRGIAKLSDIPKLFEKCIVDSLTHQVSSLLTPLQHGFRKGLSAMTNILHLTTLVNRAFINGYQTDVIYTDFSKAFDKVNHNLLLTKLDKLGFNNTYLSWIKSYLLNRTQSIKFKSAVSRKIPVRSGVPQGSHLGPILFLLFINDMPEAIKYCNILMYADDVKIFLSLQQNSDFSLLQNDLDNFCTWCHQNLMELNTKKCKIMIFSRGREIVHPYFLSNCQLELVTSFSDLGILLDTKLNFIQHITMAVNKARGVLAFIKRWSKEFDDPTVTKRLFTALVRPILEYGSVIWDPHYNVHSDHIESVQKQFLLFCLRNAYHTFIDLPPYSTRLSQINLPTLKSRRTMLNISFLMNLINGNICSDFLLNNLHFNIPQRSLRSYDLLYVRTHRTNYAMADPVRKLCCCFNQFSNFIDFASSLSVIKRNILIHLNN